MVGLIDDRVPLEALQRMFATRHVVFVAPGRVEATLAHRFGIATEDTEGATLAPRLLAQTESAADAERLAGALQSLRHATLVAGPEQPPAEGAWQTVVSLNTSGDTWRLTSTTGLDLEVCWSTLTALTLLETAPGPAPADRALLLRFAGIETPVYLRASLLGTGAFRLLADFIDSCAQQLSPRVTLRRRRIDELRLGAAGLDGDLFPLALAVVDELDTATGALSIPLTPRRVSGASLAAAGSGRTAARVVAGLWWSGALASIPVVLWLLGSGAWLGGAGGVATAALGLVLAAWSSQRLYWSRWLERRAWGPQSGLPVWPLGAEEGGHRPRSVGMLLEALLGVSAWGLSTFGPRPTNDLAQVLFWLSPVLLGTGLGGLWEHAVAAIEDRP
jgi:hypothetical protein